MMMFVGVAVGRSWAAPSLAMRASATMGAELFMGASSLFEAPAMPDPP